MAKSRRGTNNSLKDRVTPQEVLLGVCRYVGINKNRLRVYYFEEHGYWVAPYGYKLISKRGNDVSLRRLNVDKKRTITLIGPTLQVPFKERLKDALMDLNGDEPFYNRRILYGKVFDTVGYYTEQQSPMKVYHLGVDGKPELTGEAYDKEALDTLIKKKALPATKRAITFIVAHSIISLKEAVYLTHDCPILLTQEDIA